MRMLLLAPEEKYTKTPVKVRKSSLIKANRGKIDLTWYSSDNVLSGQIRPNPTMEILRAPWWMGTTARRAKNCVEMARWERQMRNLLESHMVTVKWFAH